MSIDRITARPNSIPRGPPSKKLTIKINEIGARAIAPIMSPVLSKDNTIESNDKPLDVTFDKDSWDSWVAGR